MERYADLVISKIPELGFTNLLYHIYSVVGLCTTLDISKFITNCNGYVVDRFDKSRSAGKVSCIPISELMSMAKSGLLNVPSALHSLNENDTEDSEIQQKQKLVNALLAQYTTVKDIFSLSTSIPLYMFFKPYLREKISKAIDFSQMNLHVDDLSRAGIHTGINHKVVKMQIKPETDAWMSNHSIERLIAPFAYKTEIDYLGQYNLNFLNGTGIYDKPNKFYNSLVYYNIKYKILKSKCRYVMFGFCYLFHWKSVIFDKRNKLVAFYDSGGNNPADFYHYPYFYFYSFSEGFNINKQNSTLDNVNCDVDIILRFLVDCFGATKGCINYEVNQLLESECGMFTCIFMILCSLNPPDNFRSLRKIYTFFRFLADKKMTMLKSILFTTENLTINTVIPNSTGLKEYYRMEKWTRKSTQVLSERITTRINSLLDNYEPVH
ncbi:Virion core cysteine protease [Sea otter poxvirus]|uniref:Virion core cysteine protease n=1 Tax=Sea otter poxvirus TaxID=1416741 RepID=A0A2U9QHM4_9POXV|nr:Virion core cysteine protease [Sea otter poxvirus]AWU47093.1 Virion core cysteine protease [Sea otter poxvirus]